MKLWRIESLRGLLVLYVTIGHLTHSPFLLLRLGQEAVVTFFLISGFVIEASFIRAPFKSFLTYITARAARIYPPLILLFFIVYLIHSHTSGPIPTLSQVVGNMLMLQDSVSLKPDVITAPLFSGPIWSLHYEWWFYISYYPASLFLPKAYQRHFLGILGLIAALTYAIQPTFLARIAIYLQIFWLGVEMARGVFSRKKVLVADIAPTTIYIITSSLLMSLAVRLENFPLESLTLGKHPILEIRHLLSAVILAFLSILWQYWKWPLFKHIRPLSTLAPISYSLYIAHEPLWANATYLVSWAPIDNIIYFLTLMLFCWFCDLHLYHYIKNNILINRRDSCTISR